MVVIETMGNDPRFVEAEDLPFRLVEAPPPPSLPPSARKSHTMNKRRAPPIPPPRFDGYDAPPSLLPPPTLPKRFNQPVITTAPPRSDLPLLPRTTTNGPPKKLAKKIKCCSKQISKTKLTRCVIC